MNINLIIFIMMMPLLRLLSLRRLNTGFDIKGNCSVDNRINSKSSIESLKLYLSSYHTRYALRYISSIPSHRVRNFLYTQLYLLKKGQNVVIYYNTEFRCPWFLSIGDGSIIGDNVILDASRGISIGSNVNISSRASFYSLQHDYRDAKFDCTENNSGKIVIRDRVWIGPQVIILPNVVIGEGSVVAGGAVVTRDIPPYEVWGGIPAKKIGDRPQPMCYAFDGFHPHFL